MSQNTRGRRFLNMTRSVFAAALLIPVAALSQTFEVASVKDHHGPPEGARDIRASYGPKGIDFVQSLIGLIGEAYHVNGGRIVLPPSISNELALGEFRDGYEVVAHADHPVSKEQLRSMLQSLLSDRFKLTFHRENRTNPAYRLVVAKGGPKLTEGDGGDTVVSRTPDGYAFRNADMSRLAGALSSHLDRMAVDETDLTGSYNFSLKLPEEVLANPREKMSIGTVDSPTGGAFSNTLKHLGLQLVPGRATVEYLVVDHVERPSAN